MSKFLLLLTGKFSAVKAYLKRVIADGGTTSDPAHAQVVYDNTIGDEPTLIQSCDSGKATVLYNIEPTNADFTVDRNSTKYVLGSGGTIISYATDESAFEFNADGSYKGLLVELAATNVMFPSIPDTTWSNQSGVTITTNDAVAPDGTTTATRLEGSTWLYRNSISGTNTGTWTISCWVKAVTVGTNNTFRLSVGGNNFSSNLTATGEWQRFEFTQTNGGGTVNGLIRDDLDNSADLYIWGAQVETGPIATSYIPTTTASVTRVKDDITQTGAQSLIGQTEGTLYVEVDWKTASGTDQYLLSVSDGTTSNWLLIYKATTGNLNMYAVADGNNKTNQGESSSAYSGIQKFAFAYAEEDFELYRNGSIVGTADTSGSLASLATLTDIDLGQSPTAFEQANLHIRAVALFTRRLSGTDLGALTTL